MYYTVMEARAAMDHQLEELNMKFLRFPVLDDSVKQLRKIIDDLALTV